MWAYVHKNAINKLMWTGVGRAGRIHGTASDVKMKPGEVQKDWIEVQANPITSSVERDKYEIFLKGDFTSRESAHAYIQEQFPFLIHNSFELIGLDSFVSQKVLDDFWLEHVSEGSVKPVGEEPAWVTVLKATKARQVL